MHECHIYIVRHINFGTIYHFSTRQEAETFIEKSTFEASLDIDNVSCIAVYSPIYGWKTKKIFDVVSGLWVDK